MTFSARYIANIIQFAVRQGASRQVLLDIVGRPFEELCSDEMRIEVGIYNQVLEKALEMTGDPYLGLNMGNSLSLSAAGLIAQIAQTSRTVREALEYMISFANLGCQALPFSLEEHPTYCLLKVSANPHWQEQSPASVRHTTDGVLLFSLREFHTLTFQQYRPLGVQFAYPRPAKFMEYERLFDAPVTFGQSASGLRLDLRHLEAPVVTSDYDLLRILVSHAEAKLAALAQKGGFATVVRQSIINLVKPHFPSIEEVAANLNISVRTLQRRLRAEQLSYKQVLDGLRRQFAKDYLQSRKLSIKEVAYLLDYSDASAFVRAFRRWEGRSPGEWLDLNN